MQICNSTADLHKFWNVLDVVFSYLCERRCGISNEIVLVVIHCLREFFCNFAVELNYQKSLKQLCNENSFEHCSGSCCYWSL